MQRFRIPRRIWWLLAALFGLAVAGMIMAHQTYNRDLRPVSNDQTTRLFTVEANSSGKQIAVRLEEAGLIRSAWAFQLYVHRQQLDGKLKAGTYALSPSQGTANIIDILTKGKVETRLVTIIPGRRIDQVRADFINAGFQPEAVDRALDPARYPDVPVLAYKPPEVTTLEGLLWPDSYQKQPDTDPEVIIRQSLVAMGERLTTDVQAAFAAEGLTTYQGLTLASIVLREVNKATDQTQAAQVFLSRLKAGMKLESDATAHYGAVLDGRVPSLSYDSLYNTYLYHDLPPTPISTITTTSLDAVTHPAATDWLYFVSGDNGTTYFSKTLEAHQALTNQHCRKLCGN